MASPTPFEIKLIEKVTRAKVHLKSVNAQHSQGCPTEDTESTAPCNCGASRINGAIQSAIDELDLDK
jgi:hypothetical protein